MTEQRKGSKFFVFLMGLGIGLSCGFGSIGFLVKDGLPIVLLGISFGLVFGLLTLVSCSGK